VISIETLLNLRDDPAEIPGLGPIPAEVARTLAADGRWTAWITDASGTLTATGTHAYTPTRALARHVRAREPHCRMPGCRQPATHCDLDHTTPYPTGPTNAENLGPLCRRHHIQKTHVDWHLEPEEPAQFSQHPTPAWRWRTPAGFTIHDHPDPPLT
jgi:hypothetical protein